uniref:Uncharacterized protein n=1 Tax=Sphingobacterium sp. (strain 21) TaxID=743722 RepID=F4C409_SPHS2
MHKKNKEFWIFSFINLVDFCFFLKKTLVIAL